MVGAIVSSMSERSRPNKIKWQTTDQKSDVKKFPQMKTSRSFQVKNELKSSKSIWNNNDPFPKLQKAFTVQKRPS